MCENIRTKRHLASFTKGYLNKERHYRKSDRTESSSGVALSNKNINIDFSPKREGGVTKSFIDNGDSRKTQNTKGK